MVKIFEVHVPDNDSLQHYFMRFVVNGGIFLPTEKLSELGEELFLLLHLRERTFGIAGRVVWLTPANAISSRKTGIGVQFSAGDANVVDFIEARLSSNGKQTSDRPGATL